MAVDWFGLRRVKQRQSEAILPLLILYLDVRMRNMLVLAVPNLQPIDLRHLVQHLQLLNLVMRRFYNRFIAALTGLIFKPREDLIHNAKRIPLRPRFIPLSLIIMHLNQTLIPLIAFRNVVMVIALVLLRRWILAALPIVAIDHKHIFYIEVVREKLALHLLLLVLQQRLHHWHLALRVNHVNGPFLTAFLLLDGRSSSGHHCLTIDNFQRIAALQFLKQRRQRVPALESCSHVPLDPVEPNDIKTITLGVHLIYYQQK